MSQQHQPRPFVGIIGNRYLRANTNSSMLAGIGEKYLQAYHFSFVSMRRRGPDAQSERNPCPVVPRS
jgi:hypothetical protein